MAEEKEKEEAGSAATIAQNQRPPLLFRYLRCRLLGLWMSLAQRESVEKRIAASWSSDDPTSLVADAAAVVAGKREGRAAAAKAPSRSCSPPPPMPPERSSCACQSSISHSP